jgi:uncharacterized protein (TIGR01777 family)
MRIVIPGGSGQVGTILARHFHAAGHDVLVLSRSPHKAPWRTAVWDAATLADWSREIDGADVVINLAGRSVNCRYTQKNRREIMDSRVNSTRVVGQAIAGATSPPRLWLQASTATIYAHRFDAANDEATGIIGRGGGDEPGAPEKWDFSIQVAKAWEAACNEADTSRTRKVLMRSAMVMSPDRGGIFDTLLTLTRRGLGGCAGNGRQYVSWIHEQDFCRAIDWLIARDDLSGPVNLASPNPLPYADFMRALRRAAGVRLGLPATKWMLELGAIFMKTETELVLKSRRVIPRRLLESGFHFDYPEWPAVAHQLGAKQ